MHVVRQVATYENFRNSLNNAEVKNVVKRYIPLYATYGQEISKVAMGAFGYVAISNLIMSFSFPILANLGIVLGTMLTLFSWETYLICGNIKRLFEQKEPLLHIYTKNAFSTHVLNGTFILGSMLKIHLEEMEVNQQSTQEQKQPEIDEEELKQKCGEVNNPVDDLD